MDKLEERKIKMEEELQHLKEVYDNYLTKEIVPRRKKTLYTILAGAGITVVGTTLTGNSNITELVGLATVLSSFGYLDYVIKNFDVVATRMRKDYIDKRLELHPLTEEQEKERKSLKEQMKECDQGLIKTLRRTIYALATTFIVATAGYFADNEMIMSGATTVGAIGTAIYFIFNARKNLNKELPLEERLAVLEMGKEE